MKLGKTILFLVSLLLLIARAPAQARTREKEPSRRPNVVFILTDDQRWDQMSCAGHPFLKTPHLDRLAAEGARFANAFVTTSLCSPSRASFLSGLYAHTHGVMNNFTDYPNDLPSYPRQLKKAGYTTAYIGKWHMGEDDDSPRPGFDHWISHKGQGNYYDTEFNINGKRKVVKGYYTSVLTDMTIKYIEQQRDREQPFCLLVGHKAPHTPFTPEKKYEHLFDDVAIDYPHSAFRLEGKPKWIDTRIDTWHGIYGPIYGFRKDFPDRSAVSVLHFEAFVRAYTATIKSVDDSVGRIYEALARTGQLDNTILCFAGDNGMFLGEHGMTDKRAMHEPSIRIPLLVRYPAQIKPGTVIDAMVLNIDVAPSLLELCGTPPLKDIHGESFVPLLKGKKEGRSAFLYEYNYERQFPYTPNVRGVRTDEWKYIRYPHGDGSPDRHKAELYHLKSDPEERHNLIEDPRHADVVGRLQAELHRLQKETGGLPDRMPMDEGIKKTLPDIKIR
jgi:arylsulfatase A-like enzyme